MKLTMKLSTDDLEDMTHFLEDYLKFFKKKHTKKKCDTCKLAKRLLTKIKKIQPDDLVSLKEVAKQVK